MIPDRGNVVWASLEPTSGHEQRGHRPHLVLSNRRVNELLGMVVAVPMTTKRRPWAWRVELGPDSFAMAEQPRSFSLERITRIDPTDYDTSEVARALFRIIGVPIGPST